MLLLFFILWIILNGRCSLETVLVGLVILVPVYLFFCKYMKYTPKRELQLLRRTFWGLKYVLVLLCEIVKANFCVIKLILSGKLEVEPEIVRFRTDLKKNSNKVLLANSITLTPGTITVSLEDDVYTVHCLDKELAEGIEDSIFVKMLEENERKEQKA